MNNKTLSLCMIVKNEEAVLSKCLESLKAIAHEIIIVDTGSTDKTKEIASSYGAKVFDYEWNHDFSSARNFGISQSTGEWIIHLDADEYVLSDTITLLEDAISTTKAQALNVQILNMQDENQSYSVHRYPRVHLNIPNIRYENKIHEQLVYKEGELVVEDVDVKLIHTGYLAEVVKKKNKTQRNIRILREELKEKPNDAYMNFNLGNELLRAKEYKKALKCYQIADRHTNDITVKSNNAINMVKTYAKLKQNQNALNVLQNAKKAFPEYTDLYYLEGQLLKRMGREEEAKWAFETCLKLGESSPLYTTTKGVGSLYPLEELAEIAYTNRNFEKAVGLLTEITEANKFSLPHITKVLSLLFRMFERSKVVEFINETYTNDSNKEIGFKNQIAHHFRLYPEFALSLKNNFIGLNIEEKELSQFYLAIGEEHGKEKALEWAKKPETRHLSLVYYTLTKNKEVRKVLDIDKTCRLITASLSKEKVEKRNTTYKKDVYIETIKEIMRMEHYESADALITICDYFDSEVHLQLGDIFAQYHHDDLAVQHYTKYLLNKPNDFKTHLKVARLLLHLKMYQEALLFAEKANILDMQHFKPIEIMLESCKELQEKEAINKIVEKFIKIHPTSEYLKKEFSR